ncbi:hypothetical protein BU643_06290 [Staphylococcus chromogenes]|uniref:hypothetical protein n=1 Tax=Staphylococcus chromogenes TaxID=46126 RepID=UPI000D1AF300|nr:hypothetical protein [Staphylococcus chromogenes]PTG93695.1 hypothetical protein BU643_06290 [Staphylococcus chromogenes]
MNTQEKIKKIVDKALSVDEPYVNREVISFEKNEKFVIQIEREKYLEMKLQAIQVLLQEVQRNGGKENEQ